MFVKLSMGKPSNKDIWLNTDHIVSLESVGKSFGVYLSNGNSFVLDLKQYLVLVKAMKIKEHKISTTVLDKAPVEGWRPKKAKAKTLNSEEGKGAVVEKPKTQLVKKANKKLSEHKRP